MYCGSIASRSRKFSTDDTCRSFVSSSSVLELMRKLCDVGLVSLLLLHLKRVHPISNLSRVIAPNPLGWLCYCEQEHVWLMKSPWLIEMLKTDCSAPPWLTIIDIGFVEVICRNVRRCTLVFVLHCMCIYRSIISRATH
ncbi:unnamed protein product [Caenorhabditis brenneri]